MKAIKVWFDNDKIFIETEDGRILNQSLSYYPRLKKATDGQRATYRLSAMGIHWSEIDEDVSFESFTYDDQNQADENNPLSALFDRFPELNVTKVAQRMGIPRSVLSAYICGVKKPSDKRKKEIEKALHELGSELLSVKL